jgi:uncharacterized membrane protein
MARPADVRRHVVVAVVAVVAVILAGVAAGTLTAGAVAVRPAIHSLPVASYITVKQALDISYPKFMKPLLVAAMTATLALAIIAAVAGDVTRAVLGGLAFGALLTNVLVTVRGDLPITIAMASWRPEQPPADWAAQRARWDWFNKIRTGAAILGLVLLATAVATG